MELLWHFAENLARFFKMIAKHSSLVLNNSWEELETNDMLGFVNQENSVLGVNIPKDHAKMLEWAYYFFSTLARES